MNTLKCPKCGSIVEITSLFKKEIEDELLSGVRLQHEKELEKVKLEARAEAVEKGGKELEMARFEIKEYQQKLDEARNQELLLRKERAKLEEEKKALDLELQRKLDSAKKEIEEKAFEQFSKEHKFKDLENQKRINDLTSALEDAQRKAQQGSMQTQGEVLELDLEQTLKNAFPGDTIEPVEKGVEGADIRHIVKSPRGFSCGVILWESKRTKAWQDKWLLKLKSDLRNEKAHVPVIVTTAFPKDIKSMLGQKEGVFVVNYDLVIPLAELLRKNLLDVTYQKAVSVNRTKKSEAIYEYITSHEFIQQLEALAEVYSEMQSEINKEKAAFEKIWKTREGQIKRLVGATASVYGSIQGLAGSSVPQIKNFDLPLLEE